MPALFKGPLKCYVMQFGMGSILSYLCPSTRWEHGPSMKALHWILCRGDNFPASKEYMDQGILKLKCGQYPAIHTSYIISQSTTL